jgi:hypothetical protein
MDEYLSDRDRAGKSAGLPLHKLETLLQDMENEPNWRPTANKCADYYDHKQLSQQQLAQYEETGETPVVMNLIQRTINAALGQEAKSRLGWKVDADSAAFADVAQVLSERLHEAQRECSVDQAISEAYSSQLRTGIGWIEVSRNPDPLGYPLRVVPVHRNEVWWDWRARNADKSDSAWMVRQRWVDVDEAVAVMPKHRELLEIGCHTGPITDAMARTVLQSRDTFESIHATRRAFSRAEEEWLDNSLRKRVRFYSVYYRVHKREVALASGTKRVKFNPRNPLHVMLMQAGGAKLIEGPSYEIRHAMFAGPYRLFDQPTGLRNFPLVPFVCYSADDDRSPYGLVHGMIAPQDEFNQRRTRLLWLLKAKQVFVDNDALDEDHNTFADLAREVMRPDAMFVLNANRRNANGLNVVMNQNLQAEQAQVMRDAQQLIQDVPGLYNALLGSGKDGASSGVALNSLVEQSVTSLGETTDNYRTSRRLVGDVMMEYMVQDLAEPNLQVEVGTGKKRRVVVLNAMNEQGVPINPVEDANIRVGLGDVPTTSAYRAQQQVFLSQAIQAVGNDPIARAVLVPALLEAGDLEHRHEYARWMRQQAGVPEPDELNDEGVEQMQQAQQQAAAAQQQQQAAALEAKMQELQAKVAQLMTSAELNAARADQVRTQTAATAMQTQAALMAPPVQQPAMDPEEQAIQEALAEARQAQPA